MVVIISSLEIADLIHLIDHVLQLMTTVAVIKYKMIDAIEMYSNDI
jgi:hypothetical protein